MKEGIYALGQHPEDHVFHKPPAKAKSSLVEDTLKNLIFKEREESEILRIPINPEIAEAMLEYNSNNRPLSESLVTKYAREMREGRWRPDNGDNIRFSMTGRLLDGQHRLKAIIVSGTTQTLDVVFGLKDEVFDTIDTGKMRSMADIFYIAGYHQYSKDLASTARLLLEYESLVRGETVSRDYAPQLLEEAVKDNPGLLKAVELVRNRRYFKLVPPAIASVVLYFTGLIDEQKAVEFMDLIRSPDNVTAAHPCMKFREAMIKNKTSKTKIHRHDILAMMIRAWNAFIEGRDLTRLYARQTTYGDGIPLFSEGNRSTTFYRKQRLLRDSGIE